VVQAATNTRNSALDETCQAFSLQWADHSTDIYQCDPQMEEWPFKRIASQNMMPLLLSESARGARAARADQLGDWCQKAMAQSSMLIFRRLLGLVSPYSY
jgi:hypothetical protein